MAQRSIAVTLRPSDPFPIETIRISERAKQQLITLKRNTGIEQWNVLCRWAFCISLRDPSRPPAEGENIVSSLEMHWKTFAGHDEDAYKALLLVRMTKEFTDLSPVLINTQFRLHLHRGISRLAGKRIRSIEDLARLAVES